MDPLALVDDVCWGSVDLAIETGPEANLPPKTIARLRFPTLMRLDKSTPDGRKFDSSGFSTRDLPLPLLYKNKTTEAAGHAEAFLVGSLREVNVEGQNVSGWGYLMDTPDARDCLTALQTLSVRGVSADLSEVEVREPTQLDLAENPRTRWVGISARLTALTIVPIPAFPDAFAEVEQSFVASARIVHSTKPKRDWFADPKLSEATGPIVTADGRVYGHLATWDQCHIGYPGCRKAPRDDDFSYFLTGGTVLCDNDELVRVGRVFMGGDHAAPQLTLASVLDHYAATSLAWADVVVGADDIGIWVAGAMRPKLSEHLAYQARASALSGDWRQMQDGKLHLSAILSVNVPGLPVRDYGESLVASGPPPIVSLELDEPEPSSVERAHSPSPICGLSVQDHAGLVKLLRDLGAKVMIGRNGSGRAVLSGVTVQLGPAPSGSRWDAAGRAPGVSPKREVELSVPSWGEAIVSVARATIEVAIAVNDFTTEMQPGAKLAAQTAVMEALQRRSQAAYAYQSLVDPDAAQDVGDENDADPDDADQAIGDGILDCLDDFMEGLAPVIESIKAYSVTPVPVIPVVST